MSEPRRSARVVPVVIAVIALATVAAAAVYLLRLRNTGLPDIGTEAYEETTRRFYRGLAELEVGLLEGAIDQFTQATVAAPSEPASWANLGLTHLRLGAFDAAAPAIARAAQLAPANAEIAFLEGRFESLRGQRDAGVEHLRRAVELDPANLQARTALIQEIEAAGGSDADAEAQRLVDELLLRQPSNPAVLVERARLAAKRGDRELLRDSIARLDVMAASWPAEALEQYQLVQAAIARPDSSDAAREIAFLRNVLAQVPSFQAGRQLVTPSAELIASPLPRFLRLTPARAMPAPADVALTYAAEVIERAATVGAAGHALVAVARDDEQPAMLFSAHADAIRRVGDSALALALPASGVSSPPPTNGLIAVDWNNDFKPDLVAAGPTGVQIFLQGENGAFTGEPAGVVTGVAPVPVIDATGVWAADVEMDGDLDVVAGRRGQAPVILQNSGDGSWTAVPAFAGVAGLRAFAWGDVDNDGDPDAVLIDGTGVVRVFANLQGGQFQPTPVQPALGPVTAVAAGDIDADGRIDVVAIDARGVISRATLEGDGWAQGELGRWDDQPAGGALRVFIADLDNNGALDVLASGDNRSAAWLAGEDLAFVRLAASIDTATWDIADLDGDGQLDLLGLTDGTPTRLIARQTRGYHFQVVRPRAQAVAGDQRINTFGLGGIAEFRSGLLVQKHVIAGPVLHAGLGTRTTVDVVRIVWPNGVPQADFDLAADRPVVAEQRLKGSCPWIFADDGSGMRFVTDFLWRSPLGLKINAQATAGVTQTEDWVKIRGDQMVARDGLYDVRISAELWETHFVDHVSLLVVDRPADVEVFVDERFVPGAPPALTLHATREPQPVARATDQAGRDVTDLVVRRDGRYLNTFERGRYQGVAEDHFVEVELAEPIPARGRTWLVAHGWIYPTDSSINVAIGQGTTVQPRSLSLEVQGPSGQWIVAARDLGFPAGKNKTVLIDLAEVRRVGGATARRLRLRTNLEIYWDSIATAVGVPDAPIRSQRVAPSVADLRYRGYSQTNASRRAEPETPDYARIANTTSRWRDLEGYYTRFGDVRELLADVEDRYVIMNAGDELRLAFPAPAAHPESRRDFVLIGDGWVKDGDFNTTASRTVLPLPAHGVSDYRSPDGVPTLAQDAVYQRYRDDWRNFHTRYVAPRTFVAGLAR